MPSQPSSRALQVLLVLADSVCVRPGWVKLDMANLNRAVGAGTDDVREYLSELIASGHCIPAAHGDLVYLTCEGARVARAGRELIRAGTAPIGSSIDHLMSIAAAN